MVAALVTDEPERGLDPLAFETGSPPVRMTSMSSSSGAVSTRSQSGVTPSGRPSPPQPGPGLCRIAGPSVG